ncbi:MAG TPA: PqiC family protein [Alphaproteobacteria bacterium]|nr:PqiC family protein [Alphaproteobacteria bacterium]
MTRIRPRIVIASAILVALSLAIAACAATPPTRFYALTPVAGAESPPSPDRALAVGLEPVDLPGYLDRPQIVTRSTPVQIDLADLDHWAEPLDGMVTQTLAESLFRLAPAQSVVVLPRQHGTRLDRIVEVTVRRFDVDAGSSAVLEAEWRIFDSDDQQIAGSRFRTQSPVSAAGDYQAMVRAMSDSLGLLAQEIAQGLTATR